MSTHTIKLLKKEMVANDTMAFYWERPDGFEFKAGQFGDFTLINPPETDEEGNTRAFSFVNDPNGDGLVTATRLRDSAFKRVLKDLPEGSEVKLDAPHGNFTLHKTTAAPAVFLIGGIGITPVHSMIEHALNQGTDHAMTLLYANKTREDAAFQQDFTDLAANHANFTFVPVMTDAASGTGETGHIDINMFKRYVTDIEKAIYYLSGPAGMVQEMYKLLVEAGANEDNIRAEEFSGY